MSWIDCPCHLPVDLVNFKAANPAFPQEPTADQFFSEAQWESYWQLGNFLGEKLDEDFLRAVLADPDLYFEADRQAPADAHADADVDTVPQRDSPAPDSERLRLPTRISASTVRTSLGFGAAATLGVSAWQAIDSVKTTYKNQNANERGALVELTGLWAKLPPMLGPNPSADKAQAVADLAAAIVRTADTLCPIHREGWFQTSPLARTIYSSALDQCGRFAPDRLPQACRVMLVAAHPDLQGPYPNCLVRGEGTSSAVPPPQYWVYDYSDRAPVADAHRCDPLAASRGKLQTAYAADQLSLTTAPPTYGIAELGLPSTCRWPIAALVPTAAPAAGAGAGAGANHALPPCAGVTIYPMIYGTDQIADVRTFAKKWQLLGATMAPVDDVGAAAEAAGRAGPLEVARTTVRYHGVDTEACARAIPDAVAGTGWKVEPLSPALHGRAGVVEVWLRHPGPD